MPAIRRRLPRFIVISPSLLYYFPLFVSTVVDILPTPPNSYLELAIKSTQSGSVFPHQFIQSNNEIQSKTNSDVIYRFLLSLNSKDLLKYRCQPSHFGEKAVGENRPLK
jgi:hypothetical protein